MHTFTYTRPRRILYSIWVLVWTYEQSRVIMQTLTHANSTIRVHTQHLCQPDVRRISKVGSQRHRAPYPVKLIQFTTLPRSHFLTRNLCLHLHLLISLSALLSLSFLFPSLFLSSISLHPCPHPFSPPGLFLILSPCCFQFQQECLICFVRKVKLSQKAHHACGCESPVLIKVG